MISIIFLLVTDLKIYVLKSTKRLFFHFISVNVHSSFNIENRLFKLSVVIIDIVMEETLCEIFSFRP